MTPVIKLSNEEFNSYTIDKNDVKIINVDKIYGNKCYIKILHTSINESDVVIWTVMTILFRDYPIRAYFTDSVDQPMFFESLNEFLNYKNS